MLAVIVDDNKQAAQDLAERLGDFDDVEIGGIALNGMDGLARVGQVQPMSSSLTYSCPTCPAGFSGEDEQSDPWQMSCRDVYGV